MSRSAMRLRSPAPSSAHSKPTGTTGGAHAGASTERHFGSAAVAHFVASHDFIILAVPLVGTTITPYMQLYQAAAVADRGIGPDDYPRETFSRRREAASPEHGR